MRPLRETIDCCFYQPAKLVPPPSLSYQPPNCGGSDQPPRRIMTCTSRSGQSRRLRLSTTVLYMIDLKFCQDEDCEGVYFVRWWISCIDVWWGIIFSWHFLPHAFRSVLPARASQLLAGRRVGNLLISSLSTLVIVARAFIYNLRNRLLLSYLKGKELLFQELKVSIIGQNFLTWPAHSAPLQAISSRKNSRHQCLS